MSRQREFLADAAAVQFTRQSDGIGRALRKTSGQARDGPVSMRNARTEVITHMLLSSDILSRAGALATHPPLAKRIRRIYGRAMTPLRAQVVDSPTPVAPDDLDTGFAMAFDAADLRPSLSGTVDFADGPPADWRMSDASSLYAPPIHDGGLDALLAIAWSHDLVPATLAFLVRSEADPAYTVWLCLRGPMPQPRSMSCGRHARCRKTPARTVLSAY